MVGVSSASCQHDPLIQLGIVAVAVRARGKTAGMVETKYQGISSCGWTSRSLGSIERALGWGRQHFQQRHEPIGAELVQCAPADHRINRRNGYCLVCEADLWSAERRAEYVLDHDTEQAWA